MRISVIKALTTVALVSIMSVILTSCFEQSKFDTNRHYSEIKEDAITDKDDIDYEEKGVYMRACAGFINALNDRDVSGIEKLFSDKLLSMENTQDLLQEIVDGFKGDVTDTTLLPTDLSSRTYAQWSKTDPLVYFDQHFYVFTTEETYWVSLSLYSIINDKSFIGITRLRVLTLDKRLNMNITVPENPGEDTEDIIINRYNFADGTYRDLVYDQNCGIIVCYGDSDGYSVVNIGKGRVYDIFRLTGDWDYIDMDVINGIDFSDETAVYELLSEYKPYAVGRDSSVPNYYSQTRFYAIEGSDRMLYVVIAGDTGVPEKVIFAELFDPTKPFDEKEAKVLRSMKDG